jgi:hypothetical protein
MEGMATKVWYEAHDGGEHYCKFVSVDAFLRGYWKFIGRTPYAGWENHTATGEDYIRFIGPIYCPLLGYADQVLRLLPEAKQWLHELSSETPVDGLSGPGTSEPVGKPPIKQFIQSPNHSSRNGTTIRRIILHYTTSANVQGTISWFQQTKSQVSAHYIVDKNGDIYQMVADSDKAWHAFGENADSIGIEHVARPRESLTPAQERATLHLIHWLRAEYKISKEQITCPRFTPHNRNRTDCPYSLFGAETEAAFMSWVERHFG